MKSIGQSGKRKLRTLLKRVTPSPVLQRIRTSHYLGKIKSGERNYEPEMELIRVLARAGDCVADVGASIGWYTRVLSNVVGPGGLVCSVEPVPYEFEILTFMRDKLRLGNVRGFNVALSDTECTMMMAAPRNKEGGANFYLSRIVKGAVPDGHIAFQVWCMRFDDLQKEVGRKFRFVKCDVEGHELQVLSGAGSILRDSEPSWMIEVWGDPDDQAGSGNKVFELMDREGYGAYLFENREVKLRSRSERSRSGNYFFLKPSHLPQVKARFPFI